MRMWSSMNVKKYFSAPNLMDGIGPTRSLYINWYSLFALFRACNFIASLLLLFRRYCILIRHCCSKFCGLLGVFLKLGSWDVQIVCARLWAEVCHSVFDVVLAQHPGRFCLRLSRGWWLRQRGWVNVQGSLSSALDAYRRVYLPHSPTTSSFVWAFSPRVPLVLNCLFREIVWLWLQFLLL